MKYFRFLIAIVILSVLLANCSILPLFKKKHASNSPLVNTASILAGTEKLAAPAARSLNLLVL